MGGNVAAKVVVEECVLEFNRLIAMPVTGKTSAITSIVVK